MIVGPSGMTFTFNAEEMDRNNWWWAVSDSNGEQFITSIDSDNIYRNGKSARVAAENAAFKISNIKQENEKHL